MFRSKANANLKKAIEDVDVLIKDVFNKTNDDKITRHRNEILGSSTLIAMAMEDLDQVFKQAAADEEKKIESLPKELEDDARELDEYILTTATLWEKQLESLEPDCPDEASKLICKDAYEQLKAFISKPSS